ncbi:unnamed protein product [Didymodactylos carnosus]|uniref:Uncharacterized protein n=1 Tax=Didymodactylos carnosus TaxID=1234261 RepID=A0A8S2UB34_9BILA|nr:unnamed protein product [Didymodactylos carnosus]CAF4334119.1 unnamed protein product [Didymodactylos carnosus]
MYCSDGDIVAAGEGEGFDAIGAELCSRKPTDDIIIEQYQNMSKIVKECLQDNDIFTGDPRSRHAFLQLERIIHDLYSKQLPRNYYV